MGTGDRGDPQVAEVIERALQLAEDTLEQITRIAVEQIRRGAESSSHIEAAERDMRGALRQLVLAEREWRVKAATRQEFAERTASPHEPGREAARTTTAVGPNNRP
jgi:hypothetical protein